DLLARAILDRQSVGVFGRSGNFYGYSDFVSPFCDWEQYLGRHQAVVREAMAQADAAGQVFALQTLARLRFDFAPVVDMLVQVGTGPAKTVRDLVLPLLYPFREQAMRYVECALAEGDATRRHEAAQLLWRLDPEKAAEHLRGHLAQE